MSDETENELDVEEEDEHFEKSPEELTGFTPPRFDRKKVILFLAVIFSVCVIVGVSISTSNDSKKKSHASGTNGYAATAPRSFLDSELARANRSLEESVPTQVDLPSFEEIESVNTDPWGFPAVVEIPIERAPVVQVQQYPQQAAQSSERQSQPQLSALVPRIEGGLFASSAPAQASQSSSSEYDDMYNELYRAYSSNAPDYSGLLSSYASQEQSASEAAQNNKIDFYSGASGGALSGYFLADNALWIGTIVPAVLVTAINTDLPGNVIARVTQNIYDSRTGKNLLLPQGTLLLAQYNSSVSYSQRRVQIVWDILIRPDGYQVELEGMNGVDAQGMAGIKAAYNENWFEYVKAAGIITLFSIANGKLTEEVAKRTSDEMAAAVVTSNAEFIRDIGGNLTSRAIDIQPTLTVSNGERINVMLNKNIFLPPVEGYQVTQKYTLP